MSQCWTAYISDDVIDLIPEHDRYVKLHEFGIKCGCKPSVKYRCDCFSDLTNEPDPCCQDCNGEGLSDSETSAKPTVLHNVFEAISKAIS